MSHGREFGDDRVAWHISSASANNGSSCVEAGPFVDGSERVAVRNSNDRHGPEVQFTRDEWVKFVQGVKQGEFDFFTN